MTVPVFNGAGSGVVIASGGATVNQTASVSLGDIMVLHVLQDGVGSSPSISGVQFMEDLAGTDNAMSVLAGAQNVGSSLAFHYLWIARAIAGGWPALTVTTPGDDLYCRLYSFSGVSTGATLASVIENDLDSVGPDLFLNRSFNSTAVGPADIQTMGADRLAVSFVAVDDDNAVGAFTGMTGGTWAEATAEFASATGTDGCIQLQIATMASQGTITGGSYSMAAADNWGVVGFAFKPASSGSTYTKAGYGIESA